MSLLLLRKGLRVLDNPSFVAAAASAHELTVCWLFDEADPLWCGSGQLRRQFLAESLADLNLNIRKLRNDQELRIVNCGKRGAAETVLDIVKKLNISSVHAELCGEPYSLSLHDKLRDRLDLADVGFHLHSGATLWDLRLFQKACGRDGVPLTYGSFQKVTERLGPVPDPVQVPKCIPGPKTHFNGMEIDLVPMESLNARLLDGINNVDSSASALLKGGESRGLKIMSELCEKLVKEFEKPKTNPTQVKSTTLLSPYLQLGCVSVRSFYKRVKEIGTETKPPVSLIGQLLWREHFMTIGFAVGANLEQIQGNPVCRQLEWESNEKEFTAWANGRTGFPWIDAAMRQLRQEGWIHHLARHCVACFVTRGHLYQSWERARRVFEELLLDHDFSLNACNWMWLSGSAFFHQYFRVYSPISFPKKYGSTAIQYVKKYVPEVAGLPDKYILAPWTAPKSVQAASNCVVGRDYPEPVTGDQEAEIRKANMNKMGEQYKDPAKKMKFSKCVPIGKPFVLADKSAPKKRQRVV